MEASPFKDSDEASILEGKITIKWLVGYAWLIVYWHLILYAKGYGKPNYVYGM
jgi:hypothetical protein